MSVPPGATFILGNTGVFTGDVNNNGGVHNEGVMTGTFAGSGVHQFRLALRRRQFRSLDLLPGSAIAPGNSVGAIQVAGNLTGHGRHIR